MLCLATQGYSSAPDGRPSYDRSHVRLHMKMGALGGRLTRGVSGVVGREVVDVDEDTGLVLFLRNRRHARSV